MNPPTRPPPPKMLFVHNALPYGAHIKHLTDAGVRVTETHADTALNQALRLQPDIIVLDFDCTAMSPNNSNVTRGRSTFPSSPSLD